MSASRAQHLLLAGLGRAAVRAMFDDLLPIVTVVLIGENCAPPAPLTKSKSTHILEALRSFLLLPG